MTEHEATRARIYALVDAWECDVWFRLLPDGRLKLDGNFTIDQLEAILKAWKGLP